MTDITQDSLDADFKRASEIALEGLREFMTENERFREEMPPGLVQKFLSCGGRWTSEADYAQCLQQTTSALLGIIKNNKCSP